MTPEELPAYACLCGAGPFVGPFDCLICGAGTMPGPDGELTLYREPLRAPPELPAELLEHEARVRAQAALELTARQRAAGPPEPLYGP